MVFLCRRKTSQSFIHSHFYCLFYSLWFKKACFQHLFPPLEELTSKPICYSHTWKGIMPCSIKFLRQMSLCISFQHLWVWLLTLVFLNVIIVQWWPQNNFLPPPGITERRKNCHLILAIKKMQSWLVWSLSKPRRKRMITWSQEQFSRQKPPILLMLLPGVLKILSC